MKKEDKLLADQAWRRMEEILDQEMPVTEKKRRSLFWWIGLSTLIFVSILAYANIDIFSELSDINEVQENQIFVDSKAVEVKGSTKEQNIRFEEASRSHNSNSQFDDELVISKNNHGDEKGIVDRSKHNNIENKINLESKENKLNRQVSDHLSASVIERYYTAIAYDNPQSALNENVVKQGRNDIKNELRKIYGDDYPSGGLMVKKNTSEYADLNENTEVFIDRNDFVFLDRLPMAISGLRYVNKTFDLAEYQIVDVVKSSGDWMFGGFASYQYLDKDFMGYDIGVTSACNSGGRYDFGMKIGFERLQNTNNPVLSDAKVGVLVLGPDSSSGSVTGSIFNSTKNAGFELNDVLLSINNLMTEFTVSYKMWSRFSFSTGIGYKRLLSVSTRPISGLDSDALSDPNFEMNTLDNDDVLNSPSVNRNKFYVPFELQFRLKKKMAFGIGAQSSINRNFEKFDENLMALYARASFRF